MATVSLRFCCLLKYCDCNSSCSCALYVTFSWDGNLQLYQRVNPVDSFLSKKASFCYLSIKRGLCLNSLSSCRFSFSYFFTQYFKRQKLWQKFSASSGKRSSFNLRRKGCLGPNTNYFTHFGTFASSKTVTDLSLRFLNVYPVFLRASQFYLCAVFWAW